MSISPHYAIHENKNTQLTPPFLEVESMYQYNATFNLNDFPNLMEVWGIDTPIIATLFVENLFYQSTGDELSEYVYNLLLEDVSEIKPAIAESKMDDIEEKISKASCYLADKYEDFYSHFSRLIFPIINHYEVQDVQVTTKQTFLFVTVYMTIKDDLKGV